MARTELTLTEQTPVRSRGTRRVPAVALAIAALALTACSHSADEYPSPYGPSRAAPLPPVAGGGLWSPVPIRATGFNAATLVYRLPPAPRIAPPLRSSETPELLTPQQQAERRGELEAARANAGNTMDERLRNQGRIRGPGPNARPAIDPAEGGDRQ